MDKTPSEQKAPEAEAEAEAEDLMDWFRGLGGARTWWEALNIPGAKHG